MRLNKIDQIFVINLVERPERRNHIANELHKYGINSFTLIPGQISEKGGETGLKMTIGSIFSLSIKQGYNNVLVIEDDAEMTTEDFNYYTEKCLEQLPEDYHILYFGANLLMPQKRYSENLLNLNGAYAAHFNLYSRKAMELILPLLLKDESPYDIILARDVQTKEKCFVTYPMLVTQKTFPSDIADFEKYANNPNAMKYVDHEMRAIKWCDMISERWEQFTKNIQPDESKS